MVDNQNHENSLDYFRVPTEPIPCVSNPQDLSLPASRTQVISTDISSTAAFAPRFPPHPALQDLLAKNRPSGPGHLPQDFGFVQQTLDGTLSPTRQAKTTDRPRPLDEVFSSQSYTDEHEHKKTYQTEGKLPIAATRFASMAAKPFDHTPPRRPPLTSHQSNSVPSTPHQHPHDFRSKSRSPSPHRGLGGHSPPFSGPKVNGTIAALPKGRPACKYEISAAFSRRRMQYDIGDAPLEKPKEEPKKRLSPAEEKKLTDDMRLLYKRLLPSSESEERRRQFIQKLETILHKEWPGNEFQVNVFGSSGNMLCTSESDVDICIQTPMKKLATMHMLAEALANNGMEKVICVAAAKVPIVKVWDPELKLAADVNVNNSLALENTRMIKTYIQLDERVRPLAMVVKHWTRQRILNDAGIGGTLSSYAWICLIINFLQSRTPPILPSLHLQPHAEYIANDGTESGFSDDIAQFRGFGSKNTETIGELLFHLFRHYTYELDYESSVISVRHGRLLTRQEKHWDHTSKEGQWRLCIEEPFNTSRNLGNSADSTAFRGIQLELQRAFDLLADNGQLEKCCEPYQFPLEEKPLFKKPTPGNKSITLTAPGQSNRNNRMSLASGSLRGVRSNTGVKGTGTSYRRASGGATFGRLSNLTASLPFLPNPVMPTTPEMGQYGFDPYSLYLRQGSDAAFREQFYAQHAATMQAQSVARAHANAVVQAGNSSRDGSAAASPQKTPYMAASPQLDDMQQSMLPLDGPRTNPSSPSMTASTPVRRGFQRGSVSNGSQSGAVRSQSQPARGLPAGFSYPMLTYDATGRPYYTGFLPQELQQGQRMSELAMQYNSAMPMGSSFMNGGVPKEYVGYFVKDLANTQPPTQYQKVPLQQIPSYTELRRNRVSQQELLPLRVNGTQRASRSPSPLGHARTLSTPLRSAPLPGQTPTLYSSQEPSVTASEYPRQTGGLLIINGSGSGYHGLLPESNYTASTGSRDRDYSQASDLSENLREQPYSAPLLSGPFVPDAQTFYRERTTLDDSQEDTLAVGGAAYGRDVSVYGTLADTPQPFPPFVPIAAVNGTSSGVDEEPPISPRTARSGNQRLTFEDVKINRRIESPPSNIETPKQAEPRPGPLLSPVIETHTPSPTGQRRSSMLMKQAAAISQSPLVNGTHANNFAGAVNGKSSATRRQSNAPVPPTPAPFMEPTLSSSSAESPVMLSNATNMDQHLAENANFKSSWEVKTKKKKSSRGNKKKAGSAHSKSANDLGGQLLPSNDIERKGG